MLHHYVIPFLHNFVSKLNSLTFLLSVLYMYLLFDDHDAPELARRRALSQVATRDTRSKVHIDLRGRKKE